MEKYIIEAKNNPTIHNGNFYFEAVLFQDEYKFTNQILLAYIYFDINNASNDYAIFTGDNYNNFGSKYWIGHIICRPGGTKEKTPNQYFNGMNGRYMFCDCLPINNTFELVYHFHDDGNGPILVTNINNTGSNKLCMKFTIL